MVHPPKRWFVVVDGLASAKSGGVELLTAFSIRQSGRPKITKRLAVSLTTASWL